MQIVLLSGGSGKRLWPLSNGTRSKQFLRLLSGPNGIYESMLQRVFRQIKDANLTDNIVIATSKSQEDAIISQLGNEVSIVTEPERRDTFPAIALSCFHLVSVKGISDDEVIVVMPCDPYTDDEYFAAIQSMAEKVKQNFANIMLLGIKPTHPSTKFGYILPNLENPNRIDSFKEKPKLEVAKHLLEGGAVWNGGVFAFKLGYLRRIINKYLNVTSYTEFINNYKTLPKISFDYEVVEKTNSLGVEYFDGPWKDLGTWDSLSRELNNDKIGNVIDCNCINSTAINELNIPLICHGIHDLIVAASPDGILVAEKSQTSSIKDSVNQLNLRPMFEERRWGAYKVVDNVEFEDGFCALTKQITLNEGCSISYQQHTNRDEVLTFIDGRGEVVIDNNRMFVRRGDTITIRKGQKHALRALTSLTFIEIQRGINLVEEDIERFDYNW